MSAVSMPSKTTETPFTYPNISEIPIPGMFPAPGQTAKLTMRSAVAAMEKVERDKPKEKLPCTPAPLPPTCPDDESWDHKIGTHKFTLASLRGQHFYKWDSTTCLHQQQSHKKSTFKEKAGYSTR